MTDPTIEWPDDPAGPSTPVAHSSDEVASLAASSPDLGELTARQSVCRACPRLVEWREQVATERRKSFATETYWGRPIAGWGSDEPRILILGLAPAAHGGNRTGRIFTGDRSGDWLFAALHEVGLAALHTSIRSGDGQQLFDTRMAAAVRCAPPANKPTPAERDACFPWLTRELEFIRPSLRSIVALGSFAWDSALKALEGVNFSVRKPKPKFTHGAETVATYLPEPDSQVLLLGSFHPSQQNTFTGKLTPGMMESVFERAKEYVNLG